MQLKKHLLFFSYLKGLDFQIIAGKRGILVLYLLRNCDRHKDLSYILKRWKGSVSLNWMKFYVSYFIPFSFRIFLKQNILKNIYSKIVQMNDSRIK